MPKYAILLYRNEATFPAQGTPESKALYAKWAEWGKEFGNNPIQSVGLGLAFTSSATTVRVRDGKTLCTDGPFAETKEQLGGVWVWECKDLDEAINWAKKIPDASHGSVEIRPLWGQ